MSDTIAITVSQYNPQTQLLSQVQQQLQVPGTSGGHETEKQAMKQMINDMMSKIIDSIQQVGHIQPQDN